MVLCESICRPLLGIAVAGCGGIAQVAHLKSLSRIPGVRVVALADADSHQLARAARLAPQAAVFTCYQNVFLLPMVDAVVVCLPPSLHAETARLALQYQKHLYLEKPLATSLAEGQQVAAAWRNTALVGMMGFNYRFNALYEMMRTVLHTGVIGRPLVVHSAFTISDQHMPVWKQTRQQGGGVLLDLAIHHIDLMRFLFDATICDIWASIQSRRYEADTAVLRLRLSNGVLVQSFFSLVTRNEDWMTISGECGTLSIDRERSWRVDVRLHSAPQSRIGMGIGRLVALARSPYLVTRLITPRVEPSYQAALAHFVAAIRQGGGQYPTFEDGLQSLAVVAAAEESAATGQTVMVGNTGVTGIGETDADIAGE